MDWDRTKVSHLLHPVPTVHPIPLYHGKTQNIVGKMAQMRCGDGVLLCHPHLVWLVFEESIPTCACFHSENILVTFIIVHIFLSYIGMQPVFLLEIANQVVQRCKLP